MGKVKTMKVQESVDDEVQLQGMLLVTTYEMIALTFTEEC